jgi:hypothetical protein
MNGSFTDILSDLAYAFAAFNIAAALYYHYRYAIRPAATASLRNAQCHWVISAIFLAVYALTDRTLSTVSTIIVVAGSLAAPAIPLHYLRTIGNRHAATVLDHTPAADNTDHCEGTR